MARDFGRPINRIVIHCTATSQEATVDAIENYWKKHLKWKNPGYHYVIGVNGERHILQHLSQTTNGVKNYNWDSVHISYIGGLNDDDRTDAQKQAIKDLLIELRNPEILGPIPVVGHRDLSPDKNKNGTIEQSEWIKRCPSFDVKKWMSDENI